MMILNIDGTDYKVKFGLNSLADSDLLDRVQSVATLLNGGGAENDEDVLNMGKLRELFCVIRELLFVGFQKYNPVEAVQEVGNLLDIYMDETPKNEEGEPLEDRGFFSLFTQLGEELSSEGFLANFLQNMKTVEKMDVKAIPQDHKRKATKKK